ncbi:MAG: 2Fe-2S iron-sulfur cluster-binding protein [Bacteroidota bacterium]
MDYHPLRVMAVTPRAEDATTFTFEVPKALRETFASQPGQHLNIRLVLDGEEARRSYSVHNCTLAGEPPAITVRRVPGGLVSNALNDRIRVDDVIECAPPSGSFGPTLAPDGYRQFVLIAAGSGITPMLSILRSVLHAEPRSFVDLLYGNHSRQSALFADDLDGLADAHPTVRVQHTFSSAGWWASLNGAWRGRIDAERLRQFVNAYPPRAQTVAYYVCGPGGMNASVRATLLRLGVLPEQIHMEHYGAVIDEAAHATEAMPDARLVATLRGETVETQIAAGRTVLQALRNAGGSPPYSCESGVCATCRARVTEGKVRMRAAMGLSSEEIDQGYVLTCQSIPVTEAVALSYDA